MFDGITDYLSEYVTELKDLRKLKVVPGECIIVTFHHIDLGPLVRVRFTFDNVDESYTNIRHIPR